MSYFSSLGRISEGSGGPYVLMGMEAVAPGSLNKFFKGNMYNRCGRVHILSPPLYMPFIFKLLCRMKSLVMNLKVISSTKR